MKNKVIDIHQHSLPLAGLDERVRACEDCGISKAVILGLPARRSPENDNAMTLAMAQRHPDLFIPFYGLEMDSDTPDDVVRFQDQGFTGLKFIAPMRPYNDIAYFSLYEKAAELKLPVLFHLGIVANTEGWHDCDSNNMRPIHLDHIARRIPELTIIGAHFGNPWCEEAAMSCRWNSNLFFDFSGSLLKYRKPDFLNDLLWWRPEGPYAAPDKTHAWQKILFGSDVDSNQIAEVQDDYEKMMAAINLSSELRAAVRYTTAVKILGIRE